MFINHEDIPNCYYDKKYEIKNKKVYGILRASKDIKKGEELNIDYKKKYYKNSSFGNIYEFQIYHISNNRYIRHIVFFIKRIIFNTCFANYPIK